MRRLLTVPLMAIAAVALPTSLAVVIPAGSAYSTAPSVTCTKVSGTITLQTFKDCSNQAVSGGAKAGKGEGSSKLVSGDPVITWLTGGTDTETYTYTITAEPTAACGAKASEIKETTTVISGTGSGAGLVGQVGSGTLCLKGSSIKGAKGVPVKI